MLCGGTTAERRIGGSPALPWWHSVRARCEQKLPAGGYSLEAAEKPAEDLGLSRAQNGEVKCSRGLLGASQEGWGRTRGAGKPSQRSPPSRGYERGPGRGPEGPRRRPGGYGTRAGERGVGMSEGRRRFDQYAVLRAIASSAWLSELLVFKGGDALDFVWSPNRSTIDLDFSADMRAGGAAALDEARLEGMLLGPPTSPVGSQASSCACTA